MKKELLKRNYCANVNARFQRALSLRADDGRPERMFRSMDAGAGGDGM